MPLITNFVSYYLHSCQQAELQVWGGGEGGEVAGVGGSKRSVIV